MNELYGRHFHISFFSVFSLSSTRDVLPNQYTKGRTKSEKFLEFLQSHHVHAEPEQTVKFSVPFCAFKLILTARDSLQQGPYNDFVSLCIWAEFARF